jgi:uncharacterized protein (DUF1684 family)
MPTYTETILQERAERDQRLTKNPLNWLALCGLFWLEEGDTPFGSNPTNPICLPKFPVAYAGVFHLFDGKVSLAESIDGLTVNGKAPEDRPLRTDHDGNPDNIEIGSLTLRIIRRGERLLVRAWDREAQAVKDFKGFKYYPVKNEYRISAKFTAYDPPLLRQTFDAIGSARESAYPGWVEFSVDGVPCRLEAEEDGDELLFNFTDLTKTDTSYPGGRYFTIPKHTGSKVTLDFNQAINWPCAYTSFATCPLPPFENRLNVRIEAGELRYHD